MKKFISFVFLLYSQVSNASLDPEVVLIDYTSLSPDSSRIVFSSTLSGLPNIWTSNLNGTDLRRLTPWNDAVSDQPDWSSVEDKIVFSSSKGTGIGNIWAVNADGTGLRELTEDGSANENPRWSPDGTKIAFVSNRSGIRLVYVMDGNGGNVELLSPDEFGENENVNDPAWSPNGDVIAVSVCDEISCMINTVDVLTGDSETIDRARGTFHDISPDWTENGIAFSSNRTGQRRIWVATGDELDLAEFNTQPQVGEDFYPRWFGDEIITSRSSDESDGIPMVVRISSNDNVGQEILSFEEPIQPSCGNDIVEDDEMCDDGNNNDGDRCSFDCGIKECKEN